MKYSHTVKHNGVIYPAGTEVPVGKANEKVDEKEAKIKELESASDEKEAKIKELESELAKMKEDAEKQSKPEAKKK